MGLEEIPAPQDIDIIDDQDEDGSMTGLSLRLNSMMSDSNHTNEN